MKKPIEDGDYVLKDKAAWIEVNGIAFRIRGHGRKEATIEAYLSGKEMHSSILSSYKIDLNGRILICK